MKVTAFTTTTRRTAVVTKNSNVIIGGGGTTTTTTTSSRRIDINESYEGLECIHTNPDIYVLRNFLDNRSCDDLIMSAKQKGTMERSPVAYAGWTTDFKDLFELAATGPVTWLALIGAWWQLQQTPDETYSSSAAGILDLVIKSILNYIILLPLAGMLIGLFTKFRADELQSLRTSTSTTLDQFSVVPSDDDDEKNSDDAFFCGTTEFVKRAAHLFGGGDGDDAPPPCVQEEAKFFEAPTVIRYEKGQALAPHYDANRSAHLEDKYRGGQTLATLIVYLNNVREGGLTRFGKLKNQSLSSLVISTNNKNNKSPNETDDANSRSSLTICPKKGDALLFFPADANGKFDERTEHEGCPVVDEKWIARIWKHEFRVPPPYGLSDDVLSCL